MDTDTQQSPTTVATPTFEVAPGRLVFAESVVEVIAGIAAREVPGVHRLGTGLIRDAVSRVRGTRDTSSGVSAEVGVREIAVDVDLVIDYGYNLHDVAQEVRLLVADRLRQMSGLHIKEVNVTVVDIHYEPNRPTPYRRVE